MQTPMQLSEPKYFATQTEGAVDVSVIVPTYREAENLPILIPRVLAAFETSGQRGEIIVVDDNSNDGTEAVCEKFGETFPVRLLIRRNDRGLSSAVVHGMRHARGDTLLVMDADLSHPPERIPEMLRALSSENCDFVIGSRYVRGAGMDDKWGLFRWLNSKVATWLAWPLTSANDPMAGFFCLRRQTANAADSLDPIGYKIGLELIVKARCRQICEVPIHFSDRLHGESKLSLKEQLNYLRHLKRLYEFKYPLAQPIQFATVGASGVIVDLSLFWLLLLSAPLYTARAVAIGVAMTWNFWLNRRLTFSYARREPFLRQYVMFCASCMVGAAVNWSVSVGLAAFSPYFERWAVFAAFLGVVAGTGFNYLLSSRVVFVVRKKQCR